MVESGRASDEVALESLQEAVRCALNGDAILFLGAGAARDAQREDGSPLPVGQELSDALATECGLGSGYPLDSIAQHLIDARGEATLIGTLRKLLTVKSAGDSFREFAAIPWWRVWTTNYDNAFELALDAQGVRYHSLTSSGDVANAQAHTVVVLHINGALATINHALTPDFVLTSASYATQTFVTSEWSTVFRNDLQRAKAVIFVGYSLADIDIARLIFNPELFRSKIHFVDRLGIDPVLRTKLSKFGTVHPIGLEAWAHVIAEERAHWSPPEFVEEYQCWGRVEPQRTLRPPTDDDFFDLILRGIALDELQVAQLQEPTTATYTVIRECEAPCIRHLGQNDSVSAVIGSFANGKTVAIRSIALNLAGQGRDVFEFTVHAESAMTELQRLCRRAADFVLIIENYSRNLELVECFCRYARPGCSLLTSERAEVHELRAPVLRDRIKTRILKEFDVDHLGDEELRILSQLLSLRGLWGERAGLNELRRLDFLKNECGRELQAVLLEVAKSPQIKAKLNEIVGHFLGVEGGVRVLVALCVLQAIGEVPRTDVATQLLNLSYDTFRALARDSVARQILAVHSGVAAFRSPIMAAVVLANLPNATTITEVVAECVKHGERVKRADRYLGTISRELMRFGTLERILPQKGKRSALQNFYEDLKNVPSIRNNPHFWLQYAMARLSLGELGAARKYFEQSYALAGALSGYDTFQIDNHYCRLLLREAEDATDPEIAFRAVDEALRTLKKQVLRETRHYPYRSAWNLEGVAKRHGKAWSESQRESVVSAAKYLIDAAHRLEERVKRSTSVVGGLQRLNSVVAELSTMT